MGRRGGALGFGLLLLLAWVSVARGGGAATSTPTPKLAAAPRPSLASEMTGTALGKSLAYRFGCATCHSSDGSPKIGPSWKGLYGKEEILTGGARMHVDEAYLHESIVAPNAKIVKGYVAGFMPKDLGQKLSGPHIQAIIEYIKTLR